MRKGKLALMRRLGEPLQITVNDVEFETIPAGFRDGDVRFVVIVD